MSALGSTREHTVRFFLLFSARPSRTKLARRVVPKTSSFEFNCRIELVGESRGGLRSRRDSATSRAGVG